MGGCATKPKVLETDDAPAPIEPPPAVEAPPAAAIDTPTPTEKVEVVPEEKKDGEEAKKEEPATEPAREAPKVEEMTAAKEAVPAESMPKEAEAKPVEEAKETPKEVAA